jgi:nicotinamidase/pyrazinamidase
VLYRKEWSVDTITAQDALIVVDVQNDFMPGGSLGVDEGDVVVPLINRLVPLFEHVVYTRDWHPVDHVSFDDPPEYRDGSWPAHCVQGTRGAEFHRDLKVADGSLIVSKGDDPRAEAYSGFQATSVDLAGWLREHGIERLMVAGLATDYCVRATALDAVRAGFEVRLVEDAVRGVAADSSRDAFEEMRRAGVGFTTAVSLATATALSVALGPEVDAEPAAPHEARHS